LYDGVLRDSPFQEPNYYLKMERMDIDKVSKTKGIPDFTLELFFEPVSQGRRALEANSAANSLSSGSGLMANPALPAIEQSLGVDAEMIQASLTMMLEGRKMTRFYLGNKEIKEKEVRHVAAAWCGARVEWRS
jgi:hypothetical protein